MLYMSLSLYIYIYMYICYIYIYVYTYIEREREREREREKHTCMLVHMYTCCKTAHMLRCRADRLRGARRGAQLKRRRNRFRTSGAKRFHS